MACVSHKTETFVYIGSLRISAQFVYCKNKPAYYKFKAGAFHQKASSPQSGPNTRKLENFNTIQK